MNTVLRFLLMGLVLVLFSQCSTKGTVIQGKVTGAENLQVFLDEVVIGKAATILGKADIGSNGSFKLRFPEGLASGIYNLRIGATRINLILTGNERKIELEGELNAMNNYELTLEGSEDTEVFAQTMRTLIKREMTAADVANFVDSVSNPMVGAFIAYRSLGATGEYLETHKKAFVRLTQAQPDMELTRSYGDFISLLEKQYLEAMSKELVQLGSMAPDIRLPSPSGKEYALSSLKGKVVLLDFWASWCGPCRRENPNVVAVYNKYKDKGFTIFSVSLDGVDEAIRQRVGSPAELKKMLDGTKTNWINAIAADNLSWEYHVSDLKRWSSTASALYGVRSIPRAFLIDREGKIVSTSVRGAEMIEQELLKHL